MNAQPRLSLQTVNVLALFLTNPKSERYGLEIAREANLPSGTLYPILARLEQHGWLESDWEDIDPVAKGRRPRRYYKLTGVGALQAQRTIAEKAPFMRLQPGVLT